MKGRARQVVTTNIADAKALLEQLEGLESGIEAAADMIAAALLSGHKLLACGNGGSAADAALKKSADAVKELCGVIGV